MKRFAAFISLVLVTLVPFTPVLLAPASAQSLDLNSAQALDAVMKMLMNPAQRGAAIANSPQASAADSHMRTLAGDKLMDEFYGLAAQVFAELTRASGGDPAKMAETLSRAQSDPAAFAAMLSSGTLAKLQELATKISDQKR